MGQTGTTSIRPFRANDWWTSKAALLMGFVYLYTLWFHISLLSFIPLSLLSITVIAGFASFGYLVNDFFDKEKDRLAGKGNFLLNKPILYQMGLPVLSLLLIALPWLYLPCDRWSFALIGIQLSLFVLYSAPPLRLKERGSAGVVIDALYAHAVPTMLAAYTFLLASTSVPRYAAFLFLFLWQFLCGVRNIVIHQQEDAASDKASNTKTFANAGNVKIVLNLLQFVLIAELLCCVVFFSLLTLDHHSFGVCIAAVLALCFQPTFWYIHITENEIPEPPLRYFPNNVYEKWLPLVYLLLLSFSNVFFLIFLFAHISLFNFGLYRQTGQRGSHIWKSIPFGHLLYLILIPVKTLTSTVINHVIYYSLLLLGIDLKKEQMSALEYFKKRKRSDK